MFTRRLVVALLAVLATAAVGVAQFQRGRYRPMPDRGIYPTWEIPHQFKSDVFTFVRIRYNAAVTVVDGRWDNDYPDADWNFCFRLQQLTSMKVDPDGLVLELTDPRLFDYPFIYMIGVRDLHFSAAEVEVLRRYLLCGGFLVMDDFWAHEEWQNAAYQMSRVLPESYPRDLPLSHEIFHCVFDLKEKPQVPSIQAWRRGDEFEYWHGPTYGDEAPHFQAYHDSRGRMVALLLHNNDICDGWEREGEETEYFHKYSEKWSYPMGINIIFYAMTH